MEEWYKEERRKESKTGESQRGLVRIKGAKSGKEKDGTKKKHEKKEESAGGL